MKESIIALIPARMGSQRLKQKNLRELAGLPLIVHAIRKCKAAGMFDAIWVNSEHPRFGEIARTEGVHFHQRPAELGNNQATSEDYIREFLQAHPCEYLFQVHSIAPLLTSGQVAEFVSAMTTGDFDVMLSYVPEQIECALDGQPVNFSFTKKTNSQELRPIQRVTWSITGWRTATYLATARTDQCATYAGKVGFFAIDRLAGHIIKTEDDFKIVEVLWPLRHDLH